MNFLSMSMAGLLALSFAAACIPGRAAAEQPSDPAETLVTAMTDRLRLMQGVAQYKWDHAIPVEDLKRERVVLDNVVADAKAQGVPVDLATDFFEAQITAAKTVQSRLFDTWKREGAGPFPDAPDLNKDVRPAISTLTGRIIEALAALGSADTRSLCTALDTVPAALADDAEAWHIAVAPLRKLSNGC